MRLDPPFSAEGLEIRGGQVAIFAHKLLERPPTMADVSAEHGGSIANTGHPFVVCVLFVDDPPEFKGNSTWSFLLEVIEHIPRRDYIMLAKVTTWLKPEGLVLLTTSTLFRLSNLVRMIARRYLLDRYFYPYKGQGLGHQLENSADHLSLQIKRAALEIVTLTHDQLGQFGNSAFARAARRVTAALRPWEKRKEALVAVS